MTEAEVMGLVILLLGGVLPVVFWAGVQIGRLRERDHWEAILLGRSLRGELPEPEVAVPQ